MHYSINIIINMFYNNKQKIICRFYTDVVVSGSKKRQRRDIIEFDSVFSRLVFSSSRIVQEITDIQSIKVLSYTTMACVCVCVGGMAPVPHQGNPEPIFIKMFTRDNTQNGVKQNIVFGLNADLHKHQNKRRSKNWSHV